MLHVTNLGQLHDFVPNILCVGESYDFIFPFENFDHGFQIAEFDQNVLV